MKATLLIFFLATGIPTGSQFQYGLRLHGICCRRCPAVKLHQVYLFREEFEACKLRPGPGRHREQVHHGRNRSDECRGEGIEGRI